MSFTNILFQLSWFEFYKYSIILCVISWNLIYSLNITFQKILFVLLHPTVLHSFSQLYDPLCGFSKIHSSISCQWAFGLFVVYFFAIVNTTRNHLIHVSWFTCIRSFSRMYTRERNCWSKGTCLTLQDNTKSFSKVAVQIYITTSNTVWVSITLHTWNHLI